MKKSISSKNLITGSNESTVVIKAQTPVFDVSTKPAQETHSLDKSNSQEKALNVSTATPKYSHPIEKEKADLVAVDKPAIEVNKPVQESSAVIVEKNTMNTDESAERSEFIEVLKLTYLNACGELSDTCFDFILSNKINHAKLAEKFPGSASVNSKLTKFLVESLDTHLASVVTQSPVFSLSLEIDSSKTIIYVFIKFISPASTLPNTIERRIIKLIEIKPSVQSNNPIQMSRFIFEQLKTNVLHKFRLNKDNFTCLCVDNKLMDILCFSTLQLYLHDLLNKFIIVVPSFAVNSSLEIALTSWNFNNKYNFKAYFSICQTLMDYLDGSNENLVDLYFNVRNFSFELKYVDQYFQVAQAVYYNYARILTDLEKSHQNKSTESIRLWLLKAFKSTDFYFITCLFAGLFKHLITNMHQSKNSNSFNKQVFAWNLPGSFLYNLMQVQLTEIRQASVISFQSPSKDLKGQSLETDALSLEKMMELKKSIEVIISKAFDLIDRFSKPTQYLLTYLHYERNQPGEMYEIYKTLFECFDISLAYIQLQNEKLQLVDRLHDETIDRLVEFFDLKPTTQLGEFRLQYKQFFESFFEKNFNDIKQLIAGKTDLAELTLFGSRVTKCNDSMQNKLLEFMDENNKSGSYPAVNVLVMRYLSLQPILSLNQMMINFGENEDDLRVTVLENKLKLLNSIKSPLSIDLCDAMGIDLADLSYTNIF
jgi:hypothetical protein